MITGSRSVFPVALDDWGAEFVNNSCNYITAARFNQIQDAVLQLERQTLRPVLTGRSGGFTTAVTSAGRPAVLFKVYTVTLTGAATETKVAQMPAFSAAEKALFDGRPLAPSGSVHVQIRKIMTDPSENVRVVCGVQTLADFSGDSPWYVRCSTLRDKTEDTNLKVPAGTYVISLMIVRTT